MSRTFHGIVFTDCESKASEEKIAAFEERIGLKLPEDYRNFVAKIGGGTPHVRGFRCVNDPPPEIGLNYDPKRTEEARDLENDLNKFDEELQKAVSENSDEIANLENMFGGSMGKMLGGLFKSFQKHIPTADEEDEFFRKSYRPRIVRNFYGLLRPLDYCVSVFCKNLVISDVPDIRSLIPIGISDGGADRQETVYISLSSDYFGYVYIGNFRESKRKNALSVEPLSGLEDFLAGKSFSEFLASLFPSKFIFAEGYVPSKRIRREQVDYYVDKPLENIPSEEPDELPQPDSKDTENSGEPLSLKDFAKSLKLKRNRYGYWEGKIILKEWEDFIEEPDAKVGLSVQPYDEDGVDKVPKSVIKALRFTYENQGKLKNKVLKSFVKMLKSEEWSDSDFLEEIGYGEIEEIEDLQGLLSLDGIMITIPPGEQEVKVGYFFSSEELDPEHGLGVLVRGTKVLDTGISDIVYSVDYDD